MKRNRFNLFLSSIAAIGVAASILVGGTYALLSSESKVNIAITSGKVDVTATIESSSLSVPSTANAIISDGTLTINSIAPGEKISFKINITNNSNIIIKYRAEVNCPNVTEETLFNALTYSFNETSADKSSSSGSGQWATLDLNAAKNFDLGCSVSLPSDAETDSYQGQKCSLAYSIRAIPGNFNTD